MLNWGPNMDWFSIIKIDKDKVERTVELLESKIIYSRHTHEIVKKCGAEIWWGEKIPTSFIIETMRYKNKQGSKLTTDQAVFLSNFTIAGSKLLSLYKVPDVVKNFIKNKKPTVSGRNRERLYTSLGGEINTKDFAVVYMVSYEETKPGPNRTVRLLPNTKNRILIKTRLFVISIEMCTIDEFIALKKALKTFLPSLNAYLYKSSNNYRRYFQKTHNVTNEPVVEIKTMYKFVNIGPNPFKRKDDKDDKGGTVAS